MNKFKFTYLCDKLAKKMNGLQCYLIDEAFLLTSEFFCLLIVSIKKKLLRQTLKKNFHNKISFSLI